MRQPVRAALASCPTGAPAMFVSHVSAMPLHMRARGGRGCIVSVLLQVYLACLTQAQQCLCMRQPVRAALASYPSGAPAMFVSHVCQPCFSNAFAHASPWWPCVHRIGAPGMFITVMAIYQL